MRDLREALLEEHLKAQTLRIVEQIRSGRKRFDELMVLFFSNEDIISARAAWVVGHVAEARPKLLGPYLTRMLENLRGPVHVAVKRNTLRVVQEADLTEPQMGLAADLCFALVPDPNEPPAVRAYALTICHRICQAEPALAGELKLIIENCFSRSPAAVRSRARKVLKALDQTARSRSHPASKEM